MTGRSVPKRPAFAAALLTMLVVYLAALVSNKRILFAAHAKPSVLVDQQQSGVAEAVGEESTGVLATSAAGKVGEVGGDGGTEGQGGEGGGEGDGDGAAWPSSWGEYVAVNPGATLPNRGRTEEASPDRSATDARSLGRSTSVLEL
eukprot:jgi/Undpi1/3537/HiC_scaffold_16.g06909.m1